MRHQARQAPLTLAAALVALAALAAVVLWQTSAGLDHIDRMMAERSRTLYRMVATEVRNVARYGAARLERLDEVLAEIAAGGDVEATVLAKNDGSIRLAHGDLPDPLPDYPRNGRDYLLDDPFLLLAGPVTIDVQGCGTCTGCVGESTGCGGPGGIARDYEGLLALDARP